MSAETKDMSRNEILEWLRDLELCIHSDWEGENTQVFRLGNVSDPGVGIFTHYLGPWEKSVDAVLMWAQANERAVVDFAEGKQP
jgi:hypothetical protein